jgi:hypothetical protein
LFRLVFLLKLRLSAEIAAVFSGVVVKSETRLNKGIWENVGGRTWCFCGENMVKCVVNVDIKQTLFRR